MRRHGLQDRVKLSAARVAVISADSHVGSNELWTAMTGRTGALLLLGGKRSAPTYDTAMVGLREIDMGKGLIWRHLVGLRRTLRRFQPDLVHICGELWSLTAQELCTLDCSVVVHGAENLWEHGGMAERLVRRRLIDRAARRLSGYASWNGPGADFVVACGPPALPSLVLPAVIPPQPFRNHAWRPQRELQPFEILLVGRLVSEKGANTVLDAVHSLRGRHNITVTLCGTGEIKDDLRRRGESLGVSIQFLGQLSTAALADRMSRADLLVQPSLTTPDWAEQFGRSVAEAMTVGLPCLVSSSGELPHLVGHDSSAIFAEGDSAELATTLDRLICDRSLLVCLSERQTLLAARYSPEQATKVLEDFWEDVLAFQR